MWLRMTDNAQEHYVDKHYKPDSADADCGCFHPRHTTLLLADRAMVQSGGVGVLHQHQVLLKSNCIPCVDKSKRVSAGQMLGSRTMSLLRLPSELISSIASYTLPDGIESLVLTCRALHTIGKTHFEHHRGMKRQWRKLVIGTTPGAETALHFASAVAKDPLLAKYVEDANLSEATVSDDVEAYRNLHASVVANEHAQKAIKELIFQTPWFDARKFSLNINNWLDHGLDASEQYCPVVLNVLLLPLLSNVKQLTPPLGEVVAEEDFPKVMDIIVRKANTFGPGVEMLKNLQIIRPYSESGYESRIPLQQLLVFMETPSVEEMYVCSAVAVRDGYTGIPFTWENEHITSKLTRLELASCCMDAGETSTLLQHTPLLRCFRYSHETKWHGCQHDVDFGSFVAAIGTHLGHTLLDLAVTIDEMYGDVLSGVVSMKDFVTLETAELDVRIFDGPYGPAEQSTKYDVPKPWGREDAADLTRILPPSLKNLTLYAIDAYEKLEHIFNFSPATEMQLLPALERVSLVQLDDGPLPKQVVDSGAVICEFNPDIPAEPVWRASFRERFGGDLDHSSSVPDNSRTSVIDRHSGSDEEAKGTTLASGKLAISSESRLQLFRSWPYTWLVPRKTKAGHRLAESRWRTCEGKSHRITLLPWTRPSRTRPLRRSRRKPHASSGSVHCIAIAIANVLRPARVTDGARQLYQTYLDKSTPYVTYRWIGTGTIFVLFALRIIVAQGWYIVAYSLGIYLLNLFLAFISPKFDPSLEQDTDMEDGMPAGESSLPTKSDQEFKPFVRRLPEFKFWHSATRAVSLAFACCWSEIFNLPVFWPVLVFYWLVLVFLTMRRQIQSMIKYRYVGLSLSKGWPGVGSRLELRQYADDSGFCKQIRPVGLRQDQVRRRREVKSLGNHDQMCSSGCGQEFVP
nr:protein rer1 [Quercus suber]